MLEANRLLEVKNLSHRFNQHEVVFEDVSFALQATDKLALLGENGAGKTTLMHLMVGLINKQSGDILYDGKAINKEADFVFLRAQIGLVFQDPDDQLFCPSVLEDVMFGPLNQGFNIKDAQLKAQQMLTQLNLSHLAQRMASELSGGEKRMVTLASVLVMEPKILLLDEPTNALDTQAKANLLDVLKQLKQAMLIISHDDNFIKSLTNGALRLANKQLKKES